MKKPWPIFLAFASSNHPKVTQRSLGEKPDFGIKFWSGTGPFKVSEWVQGDHTTIVRNDSYYMIAPDGKPYPYLDKIIYKTIPEQSTAMAALETGQVDVLQNPPMKDLPKLAKDPRFKVLEVATPSMPNLSRSTMAFHR